MVDGPSPVAIIPIAEDSIIEKPISPRNNISSEKRRVRTKTKKVWRIFRGRVLIFRLSRKKIIEKRRAMIRGRGRGVKK